MSFSTACEVVPRLRDGAGGDARTTAGQETGATLVGLHNYAISELDAGVPGVAVFRVYGAQAFAEVLERVGGRDVGEELQALVA